MNRRGDPYQIQRLAILGAILLCTLIAGLLAESFLRTWRIDIGQPIPRSWRWLLGSIDQTFGTQTVALLLAVLLLGFALGGCWFLAVRGVQWLQRQLFG